MANTGQKHRPHIKVGIDVDEEEDHYSADSRVLISKKGADAISACY